MFCTYTGETRFGIQKSKNQDLCYIDSSKSLFILVDGHGPGKVSKIILDMLINRLSEILLIPNKETGLNMKEIKQRVNSEVFFPIQEYIRNNNIPGGSTVTICFFSNHTRIHVWKLGDSDIRLYYPSEEENSNDSNNSNNNNTIEIVPLYKESHNIPDFFTFKKNQATFPMEKLLKEGISGNSSSESSSSDPKSPIIYCSEQITKIVQRIVGIPSYEPSFYIENGYLCKLLLKNGEEQKLLRLNMTHSLGDLDFDEIVIREPEYFEYCLSPAILKNYKIVLASDGLWDVLSDYEISHILFPNKSDSEKKGSSSPLLNLMQQAIYTWKNTYTSVDDITIVLIDENDSKSSMASI